MLKFLVGGGILTLKSSKIILIECAAVSGPEGQLPAINQAIEERIKVAINPKYPEQRIMIGSTLTEECRNKLCDLLQRNLDVFAWKPADMTGVPRHIAKHRLNVRKGCPPVRQKKRGQAADNNQAIQEVNDGIMKEVHCHSWLSNPDVQKLNGKMESLNRLLAKSAEKSLPFFKTLKNCIKKSDFHCTEEGEFAFKQMNQLRENFPRSLCDNRG
ncbi:hypothetical protein Tco_0122533 [Tanacetum coccineum]